MAETVEVIEDWSIEDNRGTHESDEHWDLRKAFMIKNKDRFPKMRILSLSQVFSNMEFLGCKYPEETMELVVEMSEGIIEEYRQNRKGRLQRTFVKASDAAEKKSKGTKRHSNPGSSSAPHENKIFIRESSSVSSASISSCSLSSSPPSSNSFTPTSPDNINQIIPTQNLHSNGMTLSYEQTLNQFGENLKGLVLVEQLYLENEGPLQILNRSCGMSHKHLLFEYTITKEALHLCKLTVESTLVEEAKGLTKELARQAAAARGLEKLRKFCYTIVIKANVVSASEFGKNDIKGMGKTGFPTEHSALDEDNVGNKLLRLMGWDGGGLGKEQQGMATPISTPPPEIVKRSRLGLGVTKNNLDTDAHFSKVIKDFLLSQIWQCSQFDLQFSPEFNSDERKIIHQVAGKLGLKSRSHGKGDNRFLVVSRKIKLRDLVQEILEKGETAKYRVEKPLLLKQESSIISHDLHFYNNS